MLALALANIELSNVIYLTDYTYFTVQYRWFTLFKSSKIQFQPIVAHLKCDYTKTPFVFCIFCGISKPNNVFEYLQQLVKGLKNALGNGIIHNGKQFKVQVSSFICDAPARTFIEQIKANNGYSECDKCFQWECVEEENDISLNKGDTQDRQFQ